MPESRDFYRILPIAAIALSACAPMATAAGPVFLHDSYSIYDVAAERFIPLPALSGDAATADVLFFGEFHDDAVAHATQLALLSSFAEAGREIVLGLEMFERDVQPNLERYLAREIDEERFLAESRPWPNYQTDYRPLVETARSQNWLVRATNLPQSLASAIARDGLQALDGLPPDERRTAAARIECPQDDYWIRFLDAMGGAEESSAHGGAAPPDPMMRRIFEAQCARDETMAESIAEVLEPGTLVLHINGSFHTDHFLGIVPRLLRRRPDAEVRVIAAIQVPDPADPPLGDHLDQADYLIFTPEPAADSAAP